MDRQHEPARFRFVAPRPTLRRLWVTLGSACLVAMLSWVFWPKLRAWSALRRARFSLDAAMSCLQVTERTTEDGVRRHLIRSELDGMDWPGRCADDLTALSVAASAVEQLAAECGGECCPENADCVAAAHLGPASRELRRNIQDGWLPPDRVTALRDTGRALGWVPPAAAQEEIHTGHLRLDTMQPLSTAALGPVALARMRDGRWWLMTQHDGQGIMLCELTEGAARCQALNQSVFLQPQVFLIDGGADPLPHFQVGEPGQFSFVNMDGDRRVSLPEGTVSATTLDGGGVAALVLAAPGAPPTSAAAYSVAVDDVDTPPFRATSRPLLYAGYLIAQRGERVSVKTIGAEAWTDIGVLGSRMGTTQRACRGAHIVAVRFLGEDRSSDAIALLHDGVWSLTELPPDIPPLAVSCHDATAHLTWIDTLHSDTVGVHVRGTHRIFDVACDAAGCRQQSADVVIDRFDAMSRFFVASLGPRVLILWRSPAGDVRARVGPLSELALQPELPVLDDETHGGVAWDRAALRLLTAGDRVVLLVDRAATYGLAISENGAQPLAPAE